MGASEAGNSGSEAGAAVRWEKDGRVALVWLCNPGRRNAMGPPFWEGLPRVMTEVAADPEVAAVALLAEGDHYTVGLDLKTMMEIGRAHV